MATHKTRKNENGMTTLNYLFMSLVIFGVILLLFEFYRIYTIKQNVDIELSRAVNTAVDLSMMDIYRRDHVSELDAGLASDSFHSYLNNELMLDRNLIYHDDSGNEIFELDIEELSIQKSPPLIKVQGRITFRPTYFGNIYLDYIHFPVKAASHNKRME